RPSTTTLFPYTTLFRSRPWSFCKAHLIVVYRNIVHDPTYDHAFTLKDYPRARWPVHAVYEASDAEALISRARSYCVDEKGDARRSEEHTSELQSPDHLV